MNSQLVDLRKIRGGSMAPINEREELKSAKVSRSSKQEEILKQQPISNRPVGSKNMMNDDNSSLPSL